MPPPPQPPGIPGGRLPPRPETRHPAAEPDTLPPEEPTRNDLPRARARERQLTKPGMAAPNPAGLSRAATLQKKPSFLETSPESAGEIALGDATLQSAPTDEATPPSGQASPVAPAPRRQARATIPGHPAPPPPQPASEPRIPSPVPSSGAPQSIAVKVDLGDTKVEFRRSSAKKLAGWLMTLVLGAGGGVAGKTGHDAVADQAKATAEAERTVKEAAVLARVAALEVLAQQCDAKGNRALAVGEDHDAKLIRLKSRLDSFETMTVKPAR